MNGLLCYCRAGFEPELAGELTDPLLPVRVVGLPPHRVEVGDRQHVGDVERLRDIALPLHFAHQQSVAADAIGMVAQVGIVTNLGVHGVLPSADQWMSMPPFRSMTEPVV